MKKNNSLLGVALSMLLSLLASSGVFAVEAEGTASSPEIANIMDVITNRAEGFGDVRSDVTFVQRNPRGAEKIMKIKSYTIEDGDYVKNIVVASFPPDLKRTARLAHGNSTGVDDLWLFQPNSKRVKRLAPQNNATYFLGTEFTMEDWDIQQPQSIRKYNLKYISREACGEQSDPQTQQCYVIERIPKGEYSHYSRQIVWIDDKLYRMYRIDFYDREGTFLKTLRFDDYKQYANKYWRPSILYMVNKQTGGSTRAILSNYQFGNNFLMSAFDPVNLDRYSVLKSSLKDSAGDDDSGSLPVEVEEMIQDTKSGLQLIIDKIKSFGN